MNPNFENLECLDDPTGSQRRRLQNGAPVRVLVVDDSHPSADALSAYLQAGGMSVRTVYHGSDALREAKAWIPDCIVLDVAMPGLSGIGVAAAPRRIGATEKIPLLAFTAFDTADYIREMKEVGFNAVCRKPAELNQLEGMNFEVLGQKAVDGSQAVPATAELGPTDPGPDPVGPH
ncbi:response regulator [Paraburkholderia sp. RP-4-7]|uniref:Response regulator n=1 Tax=Paraburkholderia polaris TaxID=2728848 RepID=A0A848IL93_9BURK|nr:response regulator [Paraburkholderia polaris]NMM01893.1 response regulator [Paraburkholderia polaris]